MRNKNKKSIEELHKIIIEEKLKGTPDIEIGKKYGVSYKFIEKVITKAKGVNVSVLNAFKKIKSLYPKDFKEEKTTVWSFKSRGNWATHSGEYRGNWSPYIPRNVILKYSKPGEIVLDCFCGAGTTAIEAKLLGRRCISFDINEKAVDLAIKNVNFTIPEKLFPFETYEPQIFTGDARDMSFLKDNSIDLICTHPPYANAIHYTDRKDGDLSFYDVDDFLKEMLIVAKESFRVLKPGRKCAILIGDIRKRKNVIPLGFKLINVYLKAGFKLKELVIKRQHNCKTTGFWYENSIKHNFLLLAHEYLPIFEKPLFNTSNVNENDNKIDIPYEFKYKINPILLKGDLKIKLDKLETKTVWIFPENEFERMVIGNIIKRYANNGENVLFIQSKFLNDTLTSFQIELYLNEVREILFKNISSDIKFIVIQTKDLKNNGYTEPLAKKTVDFLNIENFHLKEIIILTTEGQKNYFVLDGFKITHEYLLVYERKKLK